MEGEGKTGNSRAYILRAAERINSPSLTELSQELHISKSAVLKIVIKLEKKGLISRHYRHSGNGRPSCVILPKNRCSETEENHYEDIVSISFSMLRDRLGDECIDEILEKRNITMKKDLEDVEKTHVNSFLETLKKKRNEQGYMTEILHSEEGKIDILQYNCPIIALAEKFETCCEHERAFLSDILQNDVSLLETIRQNGRRCHFSLMKRE